MELLKCKSPYYNRGGSIRQRDVRPNILGREIFEAVFMSFKTEVLNVQYFLV